MAPRPTHCDSLENAAAQLPRGGTGSRPRSRRHFPSFPSRTRGPDADGEYAVYPIGWRRLQFRIATANNGRRKELQQHFVLHLKVVGTLTNGNKVVLTEATTSPIVVRGRSPRNFQARKEIPLLGSSAGSRGQALVETGQGIVAGPLSAKPIDVKARGIDMQMPRAAFTFNGGGPKMPGNQMGTMRSNSYPNWTSPGHVSMSHIPVTGAGRRSFSYGHSTTAPPPLSIPTSADAALNIPRRAPGPRIWRGFDVDSSLGTARDYYPPSTTWTTTAGEANATVAYTSSDNRSYSSPGQYKSNAPAVPVKNEQGAPPPGSGAVYNGPPRGSFDAMNHYSWHAI
ncbi:VIB-1 protein [Verticillium dahliae VdLs.17]|uniref:VIB-1 protein n=1 Tax=Verticillium dahliae (strain VdLs.17 / ATCC MYA-4575 / FGSC 10137) TaxID=498257 RepID=G2WUI7_VERDV|nr:VIB-1 protein [Verticillium dahliae VdLs.17]EGY17778.1 VIB-1 protein [Verticillium dahliae VdLs.17]